MFCVSSGHSPVGSHLTNGEQDNTGSTHTHFGLTPPFCSLHHIHRIPETQPYFCDFQTKRPQIRRVKLWLFFVCLFCFWLFLFHSYQQPRCDLALLWASFNLFLETNIERFTIFCYVVWFVSSHKSILILQLRILELLPVLPSSVWCVTSPSAPQVEEHVGGDLGMGQTSEPLPWVIGLHGPPGDNV